MSGKPGCTDRSDREVVPTEKLNRQHRKTLNLYLGVSCPIEGDGQYLLCCVRSCPLEFNIVSTFTRSRCWTIRSWIQCWFESRLIRSCACNHQLPDYSNGQAGMKRQRYEDRLRYEADENQAGTVTFSLISTSFFTAKVLGVGVFCVGRRGTRRGLAHFVEAEAIGSVKTSH